MLGVSPALASSLLQVDQPIEALSVSSLLISAEVLLLLEVLQRRMRCMQ